jgi:AcrR family transcriptional regulator
MSDQKVDRRVRRTRELVSNALIALMQEKRYERVTVQDIIDRADVGRSTFYAHFDDKEDLLLSVFEELRLEFETYERRLGGGDAGEAGPWPTLAVFEHAARYRVVYRAMLGRRGADVVKRHLHRLLSELMRDHFRARASGRTRVPLDVIVELAVSGLLGLLVWWLESDATYSSEDMLDMYGQLTEPGIRAALRPNDDPLAG